VSRPVSDRLFLIAALVLALTYGAIDFLLIPGNRLDLHPVHHDDYTNLSNSVEEISWPAARPVPPSRSGCWPRRARARTASLPTS